MYIIFHLWKLLTEQTEEKPPPKRVRYKSVWHEMWSEWWLGILFWAVVILYVIFGSE